MRVAVTEGAHYPDAGTMSLTQIDYELGI
jgi:hypothetical protein